MLDEFIERKDRLFLSFNRLAELLGCRHPLHMKRGAHIPRWLRVVCGRRLRCDPLLQIAARLTGAAGSCAFNELLE
jgi:hypothetical protein